MRYPITFRISSASVLALGVGLAGCDRAPSAAPAAPTPVSVSYPVEREITNYVVLVGLACKNAILIVEFANERQLEGVSRFDAAVEAARVRLRPIVMTSACFVHMVPPYFATGAGAEMRRSLGTAVLWGAFGVTLFGIFLTPVFFSVVRWFSGPRAAGHAPAPAHGSSVLANGEAADSHAMMSR
jgi:AcrB/AcrD/AcrF family